MFSYYWRAFINAFVKTKSSKRAKWDAHTCLPKGCFISRPIKAVYELEQLQSKLSMDWTNINLSSKRLHNSAS